LGTGLMIYSCPNNLWGKVRALAVYDDGSGPALYAGGSITNAGDAAVNDIARWDGQAWSAVGTGLGPTPCFVGVRALAVYAGELSAGGWFTSPAAYLARWNGARWAAAGSGADAAVEALLAFDGSLYAGGDFAIAGGSPAPGIARWDGSAWSGVDGGVA